MDVRLINPFLYGAKEVLKTVADVEIEIGQPRAKKDDLASGDVSGIIGLTGDAVGSLAISFSEGCICQVAGKILGESFPEASREVFDAVGEITNMISGVSRTYLEKESLTVWAGIPAVVFGKAHRVRHILNSPSIVIPFSTPYGPFFIDVCIKSTVRRSVAAKAVAGRGNSPAERKSPVVTTAPYREAISAPPPPVVAGEAMPPLEMTPAERIESLKRQLEETKAVRDSLERLLKEKPFLNFQERQKYKKALPAYEAKIRRLKLDIAAVEMLTKVPVEGQEIELPRHYQNYPAAKPPRK